MRVNRSRHALLGGFSMIGALVLIGCGPAQIIDDQTEPGEALGSFGACSLRASCPPHTKCRPAKNVLGYVCEPIDPCTGVICAPDEAGNAYHCMVTPTCAPDPEGGPSKCDGGTQGWVCEPDDPCVTKICAPDAAGNTYHCEQSNTLPVEALCLPDNPCVTAICPADGAGNTYHCQTDAAQPAGYLCLPDDACVTAICPADGAGNTYHCQTDAAQPAGYLCLPDDACVTAICPTDGAGNTYHCQTDAAQPAGYLCLPDDACVTATCPPDAAGNTYHCAANAAATNGYECIADPPCYLRTPSGACFPQTSAAKFDGVYKHISIPGQAALNATGGDVTLEFWYRRGVAAYSNIFSQGCVDCGQAGWSINVYLASGGGDHIFTMTRRIVAGGGANASQIFLSPIFAPTLNNGGWHHFAFAIATSGTTTLYVDGAAKGTANWSLPAFPITGNTHIGAAPNGYPYELTRGKLHNVRLWKALRTGAQISGERWTTSPTGTGLLGNWRLDEGAGQSVMNAAGGGFNGTFGTSSAVDTFEPTWSDMM